MMAPDSHSVMPVFGSSIAVGGEQVSVRWRAVNTRGFFGEKEAQGKKPRWPARRWHTGNAAIGIDTFEWSLLKVFDFNPGGLVW